MELNRLANFCKESRNFVLNYFEFRLVVQEEMLCNIFLIYSSALVAVLLGEEEPLGNLCRGHNENVTVRLFLESGPVVQEEILFKNNLIYSWRPSCPSGWNHMLIFACI